MKIDLTEQQVNDLLSALSFFRKKYPGGEKENPQTFKAMKILEKRLRSLL